jgi:hypothetical protein
MLVRETTTQFEIAYRRRPAEISSRKEQLAAMMAAWRAAPRSASNDELMAAWLRSAIRASMPGSQEPLPPPPNFKANEAVEKHILERKSTPDVKPAVKAPNATTPPPDAVTDPFRDDPIEGTVNAK